MIGMGNVMPLWPNEVRFEARSSTAPYQTLAAKNFGNKHSLPNMWQFLPRNTEPTVGVILVGY